MLIWGRVVLRILMVVDVLCVTKKNPCATTGIIGAQWSPTTRYPTIGIYVYTYLYISISILFPLYEGAISISTPLDPYKQLFQSGGVPCSRPWGVYSWRSTGGATLGTIIVYKI